MLVKREDAMDSSWLRLVGIFPQKISHMTAGFQVFECGDDSSYFFNSFEDYYGVVTALCGPNLQRKWWEIPVGKVDQAVRLSSSVATVETVRCRYLSTNSISNTLNLRFILAWVNFRHIGATQIFTRFKYALCICHSLSKVTYPWIFIGRMIV